MKMQVKFVKEVGEGFSLVTDWNIGMLLPVHVANTCEIGSSVNFIEKFKCPKEFISGIKNN